MFLIGSIPYVTCPFVCLLCLLISFHYSIINSPSSHSKTVQLLLLLEDKEEKEKVCRMFRLLFPYNENENA